METISKTYDAKIDSKKRITIRNPKFEYYHVTEYKNGKIGLEPRELVDPFIISKKTLEGMDKAIDNINKGAIYGPIKTE